MHLINVRINSENYPTNRLFPFNLPILRETAELTFRRPVAFFVGENGTGKSTLLEAITRKCGVHIWHKPKRHIAHHKVLLLNASPPRCQVPPAGQRGTRPTHKENRR